MGKMKYTILETETERLRESYKKVVDLLFDAATDIINHNFDEDVIDHAKKYLCIWDRMSNGVKTFTLLVSPISLSIVDGKIKSYRYIPVADDPGNFETVNNDTMDIESKDEFLAIIDTLVATTENHREYDSRPELYREYEFYEA